MDTVTLSNERLSLVIKTHGAELASVEDLNTGHEYIWQAHPEIWDRHAPNLFPIIGELNHGKVKIKGQEYSLKRHGLARNQTFECIEQSHDHAIFRLTANKTTLMHYPFHFNFEVHYQLDGGKVIQTYKIANDDDEIMPFSVGGHPAFNVPGFKDNPDKYELEFEVPEKLYRYFLHQGLVSDKASLLLDNEKYLPLKTEDFQEDAFIIISMSSTKVTLRDKQEGRNVVTVQFRDFPFLGIWSKVNADFLCIEPWHGLADWKAGRVLSFEEKDGVIHLEPGQSTALGFTMEF